MVCVSFIMCPFWFNPLVFNKECLTSDFKVWWRWMGDRGGNTACSWLSWWRDENCALWYNLPGSWKFVLLLQKALPALFIGAGIPYGSYLSGKDDPDMEAVRHPRESQVFLRGTLHVLLDELFRLLRDHTLALHQPRR